jgi:hypothetical protein
MQPWSLVLSIGILWGVATGISPRTCPNYPRPGRHVPDRAGFFRRRGVPVDLKTRNFVVLVVKSEENAETAFGLNLHAQNITIKCLGGFQVVHFQAHMSYSFNWYHHFHKYGYEAALRAEVAKDSGSLRAGVIVVIFDPQLTKYADQTFQSLKSSRVLNCAAMQIGDVFGSNHVGFPRFVLRPVFPVIVEVDG